MSTAGACRLARAAVAGPSSGERPRPHRLTQAHARPDAVSGVSKHQEEPPKKCLRGGGKQTKLTCRGDFQAREAPDRRGKCKAPPRLVPVEGLARSCQETAALAADARWVVMAPLWQASKTGDELSWVWGLCSTVSRAVGPSTPCDTAVVRGGPAHMFLGRVRIEEIVSPRGADGHPLLHHPRWRFLGAGTHACGAPLRGGSVAHALRQPVYLAPSEILSFYKSGTLPDRPVDCPAHAKGKGANNTVSGSPGLDAYPCACATQVSLWRWWPPNL